MSGILQRKTLGDKYSGTSCLHRRSSESTRPRFRQSAPLSTMPLSLSLVPLFLLLLRLAAPVVACPSPDANAHKWQHPYLHLCACPRSEGEVPHHIYPGLLLAPWPMRGCHRPYVLQATGPTSSIPSGFARSLNT